MKPINLIGHPEGGRFREVFKSKVTVKTADGRTRAALTHIYYSLEPGEVSRFHRVDSDEVWNLYRGTGVYLYVWDGSAQTPQMIELSARANCYCHVVPAGFWQAARPIADTTLVGCSVGPGFEFADFELIDPRSGEAKLLAAIAGDWSALIDS